MNIIISIPLLSRLRNPGRLVEDNQAAARPRASLELAKITKLSQDRALSQGDQGRKEQ